MKLEFVFEGPPVPYERMNYSNRWAERVVNYLAYKKAMAEAIAAKYPELVLDVPPTSLPAARRKFNKTQKGVRYQLCAHVYRVADRGDLGNFMKGIEDALEDSGVIWNDKQVTRYFGNPEVFIDAKNPRIEFWLERY